MRNIDEAWGVVCELAGLEDTRIHDCRHSFASRALALGENLPMIGRLLGHSELQTTERYAHLDRDWVREAAVRISDSIAGDVLTGYPGHRGTPAPESPEAVRLKSQACTDPPSLRGSGEIVSGGMNPMSPGTMPRDWGVRCLAQ